jgi:uncharacterized membrane protein YbhN (UPF0104 family)
MLRSRVRDVNAVTMGALGRRRAVTVSSQPDHLRVTPSPTTARRILGRMHASRRRRARRYTSTLLPGAAVVLLVGWICASRGGEILAALAACPPWVLAGAVFAHLLTLALRTEAWRIVLAGAGGEELDPRTVHAANAGAFLAGTVQGSAALASRVILVRRLGGDRAPPVSQIALADAPIVLYEVCTSALLAAIASTAVPAVPVWAPWVILLAGLGALVALRLAFEHCRDRRLAAGLGVLAMPGLRSRLALVVSAFTLMAMLRTWLVLLGFGLPAGPADVALVLFSMGVIGLLPIGVGTGPTATVAALGATDLGAATAAGMAVSAATVVAVLLYAALCGTWVARPAPATETEEGAEVIPLPLAPRVEAEPELDLAA